MLRWLTTHWKARWTALSFALIVTGCPASRSREGDDASTPPVDSSTPPIDAWTPPIDAFVAPPLPEGWELFEAYAARSTRQCERCALAPDPEIERTRDAVLAGRITIDVERMRECLRTARLDGFGSALRDWTLSEYTECPGALVPRTPIGARCDTATECVDGFCQRDDYTRSRPHYAAVGCGVCVARRGEGEPCEGHDWLGASAECASGLRCEMTTATCVPRGFSGRGEACGGPVGCEAGLECLDGVCVVRLCDGLPCGLPHGSACADRDACQPSLDCIEGVCARVAGPGERCVAPDVCRAATECVDGVCVLWPALGEPCRERCARGLCQRGRCTTLAEGERCEVDAFLDACADGLICDGTCIPRPQLGETCGLPPATCGLSAGCNAESVCAPVCRLGPTP